MVSILKMASWSKMTSEAPDIICVPQAGSRDRGEGIEKKSNLPAKSTYFKKLSQNPNQGTLDISKSSPITSKEARKLFILWKSVIILIQCSKDFRWPHIINAHDMKAWLKWELK